MRIFVGTMTTLTTKRPRPTVFERRQADLADGVLKLSPSSLTFLYDECKACFWHHYNGRPRPATAFPKVFGALDNAQKELFVGRSVKDVSRSLPAGVIEPGRRVKSEAIAVPGTDYRVQFGGPVEDDAPRLPDGEIPKRRVDKNGSLASPHILDYGAALLGDLANAYPGVDGFRIDWPEYPPYTLDDWFLDFSSHAKTAASGLSIDAEDWHMNIRPSNTEPLLRLNLEALSQELMEQKRDEVLALIRS